MACRAAGPVECGTKAVVRRFDFEKIVEPQAELCELLRREACQRIAEPRGRLPRHKGDVSRSRTPGEKRQGEDSAKACHREVARSRTTIAPRMKLCPAPHMRSHANSYCPAFS